MSLSESLFSLDEEIDSMSDSSVHSASYASGVSSEGLLSIQVTINNIAMLIDSQLGMAVLRKYVIFPCYRMQVSTHAQGMVFKEGCRNMPTSISSYWYS